MRITQWGEYAVHFCVYLSLKSRESTGTVSAIELADKQGIDSLYAQQILQRLRKSQIIESVRGPQGGYKLARPAEQITLYDILIASEGGTFEVICDAKPLSETRCASTSLCGLRTIWHEFREHVNAFLMARTLAHMTDEKIKEDRLVKIGEQKVAN